MNTILKLEPIIHLSPEQFTSICHANPEAKLELTARGELVIMSPTGGESGNSAPETLFNPRQIEGEDILPGFILSLDGIL